MSKRNKQYEDEAEPVYIIGQGSYCFFHVPKTNKPTVRIEGFVRKKTTTPKQVKRTARKTK